MTEKDQFLLVDRTISPTPCLVTIGMTLGRGDSVLVCNKEDKWFAATYLNRLLPACIPEDSWLVTFLMCRHD